MKFFNKIKQVMLDVLGDIKVYRFPFFMVYDPSTFLIKGHHTRKAMILLQPGDLILRKYVHYLDGFFIPGEYSHTGVYIGDGMMIHAVSENVGYIDVIDFLRCDAFCILRCKENELAQEAVKKAKSAVGLKYDFDFEDDNNKFYCHELGVYCYSKLNLEKKQAKIMGINCGMRYLSTTFTESEHFEKVLEIRPM